MVEQPKSARDAYEPPKSGETPQDSDGRKLRREDFPDFEAWSAYLLERCRVKPEDPRMHYRAIG